MKKVFRYEYRNNLLRNVEIYLQTISTQFQYLLRGRFFVCSICKMPLQMKNVWSYHLNDFSRHFFEKPKTITIKTGLGVLTIVQPTKLYYMLNGLIIVKEIHRTINQWLVVLGNFDRILEFCLLFPSRIIEEIQWILLTLLKAKQMTTEFFSHSQLWNNERIGIENRFA